MRAISFIYRSLRDSQHSPSRTPTPSPRLRCQECRKPGAWFFNREAHQSTNPGNGIDRVHDLRLAALSFGIERTTISNEQRQLIARMIRGEAPCKNSSVISILRDLRGIWEDPTDSILSGANGLLLREQLGSESVVDIFQDLADTLAGILPRPLDFDLLRHPWGQRLVMGLAIFQTLRAPIQLRQFCERIEIDCEGEGDVATATLLSLYDKLSDPTYSLEVSGWDQVVSSATFPMNQFSLPARRLGSTATAMADGEIRSMTGVSEYTSPQVVYSPGYQYGTSDDAVVGIFPSVRKHPETSTLPPLRRPPPGIQPNDSVRPDNSQTRSVTPHDSRSLTGSALTIGIAAQAIGIVWKFYPSLAKVLGSGLIAASLYTFQKPLARILRRNSSLE